MAITKEKKPIYYQNDLPADNGLKGTIAIDCEMMGLNFNRDRLCAIQLYAKDDDKIFVVHFTNALYDCPNLKNLLTEHNNQFLGHMIRLDLQFIARALGILPAQVWCTRTASRIARTYGASHDLDAQLLALLGVKVTKSQTHSDWGATTLTLEQINYACEDVVYLHSLQEKLTELLVRENRWKEAEAAMKMIPLRAELDVAGWQNEDLLSFPF